MEISVLPSCELLEATAAALNELFSKEQGKEFLFLSSGGSCLTLLEYLTPSNFGPCSTISVLDERYSQDPSISNFAQLQGTDFYKKITENGAHSIDTKPQTGESMQSLSQRFEQKLRAWVAATHGTIIATVGIGEDAHTAGILPFPEDHSFFESTFNSENWVAAYDAGDKSTEPLRVTTTIPFFKMITHPVVFVTGESKRNAFTKLLSENGTLAESPCRTWREVATAHVFTDLIENKRA